MRYFDPRSRSSKERTPWHIAPPPPEQEKKPGKKLETPILVAIISAVVTLITSILGSPLLLTLINKVDSPSPTPAVEHVIARNALLPAKLPVRELFTPTFIPTASAAPFESTADNGASAIAAVIITTDSLELTSTPQVENPTSPQEGTISAPPLPESTFTATIPLPEKPDPPTPTAPVFFQCLAANLWTPYPTTLNAELSQGCWNLAGSGFSTDQGRLLLVHNPVQSQERGISTPISGDVDIRFTLQLDEFRTRSNKVGFLNFGIVQNDPLSIFKGGYLSYQKPTAGTASPVRVIISGTHQATQLISALDAGFQHEVLLSIQADLMRVYINGELTGDPVSLPHTERAFWIGYVLPSKGELEVMIGDFSIQSR